MRMFFSRTIFRSPLVVVCLPLILSLQPVGARGQDAASNQIDFSRDILPILSNSCFQCHGPDEEHREAGLRLDLKESMFEDLGGYAAFVRGEPDESIALERVFSDDEDDVMPPPDANLALSDKQKQLLKQWVTEGAGWSEHWAFVPPHPPAFPEHKQSDWPVNGIDQFVLAKINQNGLTPSAEADRTTLIRRLTFDLTGHPPTLNEVDDFLADGSDNAYEKVVDRLLASPRYGERMAWPWLDAARYADTDGFQHDPTREMWPWRDWLIGALNENIPFDQFTIEMLAGDMIPDATLDQVIASGFNRNHMSNGEGGRIPEETRTENVFDRTETTAAVWLGLTMTCCRCHDHKFDPISQEEYYQMYAIFNDTSESGKGGNGKAAPTVKYATPFQLEKIANLDLRISELAAQMTAPMSALDQQQVEWQSEMASKLQSFKNLSDAKQNEIGAWSMIGPFPPLEDDHSKLFAHDFGPESGVDLKQEFNNGKLAWAENPELVDGKLFEMSDTIGVYYFYREIKEDGIPDIELSLGSDDAIKVWFNQKLVLENNVARAAKPDQEKLRLTLKPGTNQILVKIVNTGGIGGFYFQKKSDSIMGLPVDVAAALAVEDSKRDVKQRSRLQDYFRGLHWDRWSQLSGEREKLLALKKAVRAAAATVMVMDVLPPNKKRTTRILQRGIYENPLAEVNAGTPQFLPALAPGVIADRLELARWLTSKENPLTARVTVNRYWQLFFGTGLVSTAEDFGRQGEAPTHPQLLDYLATSFAENGWDVKGLHKQIVMSATYRQTSKSPDGPDSSYVRDPDNRWLSRGPRYRLPSWMLRDQALAVSSLLVEKMGGPSVMPYQPAGIWEEATFGDIVYQQGAGDELYRRSVYTFWRRIVGPPIFFDAGKRQTCLVKPSRTNSPLHALTTLNETTFVESARNLAQRIMTEVEPQGERSPADRITRAFRLATSRKPAADELDLMTHRWRQLVIDFQADREAADDLLSVGVSKRNESMDLAEHAAYTVICSLILNLDEVLSKE